MLNRTFTSDYPVIDLDLHVFEDPVIFSDYLEPKFREIAKHLLVEQPLGLLGLGGSALFGTRTQAGYQYRMGMDAEEANPLNVKSGACYRYPGEADAAVRLTCMDEEGIDAGIVRNTVMASIFHLDPCYNDVIEALCIAYNDWVRDFCDADPNRLFPEALLPCGDMEATMREIERTAKLGFRSAVVRCSTAVPGLPLSDPYYDRMFACMQEMGWPLFVHPAFDPAIPSGAQLLLSPANTHSSSAGAFMNTYVVLNFMLDNIVTLGEITLGGLLDKFPKLNVVFIESGSSWLGESLYRLDKAFSAPFASTPPNDFWCRGMHIDNCKTKPSELFHRQCYAMFEGGDRYQTKEGVEKMAKNLIWCSDIPHFDAEGPWEGGGTLRALKVDKAIERQIMGETGARLLNIPYVKRIGTSKNAKPIPAELIAA